MKGYNLSKQKLHKEFNVLPSIELHWCNGVNWNKYVYVNIKWFMWMLQIELF
jgi:hypothetical protein